MIKTIEIAPYVMAKYLALQLKENKNQFAQPIAVLGGYSVSIDEEMLAAIILDYLLSD